MVSFRGQKKLGPRPDQSPLGPFNIIFPTSIPTPFICGVPPPPRVGKLLSCVAEAFGFPSSDDI